MGSLAQYSPRMSREPENDRRDRLTMTFDEQPKTLKLDWVIQEYLGCEIRKTNDPDAAITTLLDIQLGEEILAPTPFGFIEATIISLEGKNGEAETRNYSFVLEFDGDDRHCWVCVGQINKKLKYLSW
jgi:hypothetical protein